jgi:MoaA/NifB/PqqE/SkfB family radical SAM enzyme
METNYIVPEELRFAVTRKCDGGCRHCYNHSGKNTDRLTSFDINRLINEIRQLNPGFDRITLTGGEPLLEKEKVLNICRFAKSLGIRVRLVTRGWELSRAVCHELKEAGVTRVQIGLDSSGGVNYRDDTNEVWDTFHSWLRNDAAGFRKTVEAIKVAMDAGMDVSVRYSLCHTNVQDVVSTYAFVSSLGVTKFKFRVLFPDGRAKNRLIHELITGEEMAGAQSGLIRASRGNRTVVEITQPCLYALPGKMNAPDAENGYNAFKEACPCGKTAAYIDANGDVKYCLFDEQTLGNICDDPFLFIWNSPRAKEARRQRCPLDASGTGCSSFKILYRQFNDYDAFMRGYINSVKENSLFEGLRQFTDPAAKFPA